VLELGLILGIGPNCPPSPPGQWHWEAASCGPERRWRPGEAAPLGRGAQLQGRWRPEGIEGGRDV
jgi:hypothetical protein